MPPVNTSGSGCKLKKITCPRVISAESVYNGHGEVKWEKTFDAILSIPERLHSRTLWVPCC